MTCANSCERQPGVGPDNPAFHQASVDLTLGARLAGLGRDHELVDQWSEGRGGYWLGLVGQSHAPANLDEAELRDAGSSSLQPDDAERLLGHDGHEPGAGLPETLSDPDTGLVLTEWGSQDWSFVEVRSEDAEQSRDRPRIDIPMQPVNGGFICGWQGCYVWCAIPSDMRRHQRIHVPEEQRPYGCDYCRRRFWHPKDRRRHLRSVHHVGPAPDRCPGCGRTFDRPDNLRRHRENSCRGSSYAGSSRP